MWVVFATAPAGYVNSGWDFQDNYFPRKIAYKKDAEILAKEANGKGGLNVHVVKVTKIVNSLLALDLKKNFIVRCERDGTIFGGLPVKRNTNNYDPNGDLLINCPTCYRGYYYHNGGEYAEGKQGWYADRYLTVLHEPKA